MKKAKRQKMDPENPSAEEQMTDDEDGDGFRVLKERRVPAGQPFNGDDEEDDEDDEGEEEEDEEEEIKEEEEELGEDGKFH